ncbi:MAG: LemA family protein [Clostridiales bacterium]|nr:LemA family protein [Clostridiales bacterium]
MGFWIFLAIVVLVIFWFISIYNSLIRARNKVRNAFAQIDTQLQRRFDLIPNLVETVKGYAKHEDAVFEKVAGLRSGYMNAKTPSEKIDMDNQLTGTLKTLFAVAEAYPELKANQNFMNLQNDLKGTEDKIAFSRQFYNDTVTNYNDQIQVFPSNIVASMFNFTEEQTFLVDDEEAKKAPKVQF